MKNDKNPAHFRECIAVGDVVVIVRKKDRPYLLETEGVVSKILTSKAYHSRGIKVQLTNRLIGRVLKCKIKKQGFDVEPNP
ncbi:MAG: DUF2196 domain-containing protein [Bacteroidota bacterium]